jgi:hypothetical protein
MRGVTASHSLSATCGNVDDDVNFSTGVSAAVGVQGAGANTHAPWNSSRNRKRITSLPTWSDARTRASVPVHQGANQM